MNQQRQHTVVRIRISQSQSDLSDLCTYVANTLVHLPMRLDLDHSLLFLYFRINLTAFSLTLAFYIQCLHHRGVNLFVFILCVCVRAREPSKINVIFNLETYLVSNTKRYPYTLCRMHDYDIVLLDTVELGL